MHSETQMKVWKQKVELVKWTPSEMPLVERQTSGPDDNLKVLAISDSDKMLQKCGENMWGL